MNRSFWITLTVSGAICASAVMWQAAKTKSLAHQLSGERATHRGTQSVHRTKSSVRRSPESEQRVTDSQERPPSEENVERALAEIRALEPDIVVPDDFMKIDFEGVESAYAKIFPDFLRSVEELNPEELIAVAEGIPSTGAKVYGGMPSLKKWLLHLAAERDPLRIYRDEALMAELSASAVLEILGREDPGAALRLLPPMKKQTSMPTSSGRRVASILGDLDLGVRVRSAVRLLGTDLEMGLQVLSEVHDNYLHIPPGLTRPLGSTRLPPRAIPGMLYAMRRPEHAEMRDDLIEMVVMDTLFDGGVASVAERMEKMDLTGEELNTTIDQLIGNAIMESEPEQMIDWMSELRPDRIPSMVSKWAETDLQGATAWLGQQEPSPRRDRAIAEFARTTAGFDREGAAQWAGEIQDDQLREETLRKVAGN